MPKHKKTSHQKTRTVSKKLIAILAISAAIMCAAAFFLYPKAPYRIGVLLDLSGPESSSPDEVLNWAAEKINADGGIGGRKIELVYKDTYKYGSYSADITALARGLASDPSVNIVIGPNTSAEAEQVAPIFIDSKKLLISPTATSGDLFRMFAKQKFFWRTCQSDIAQIRAIMQTLNQRGVKKVALIYEDNLYGKTFKDWIGFYATEMGMDVTDIIGFKPGESDGLVPIALAGEFESIIAAASAAGKAVETAIKADPEYIIVAAYGAAAVQIKKETAKIGTNAKLFFTDAAENQLVVNELGEGTELISPAADPASGFEEKYKTAFGYYPWDEAASTYDAFLLSAYTLARSEYANIWFNRENIEDSIKKVVDGSSTDLILNNGENIPWNRAPEAISQLLSGKLPNINGASGPLNFDSVYGMDPVETHYSLNIVKTINGITDFYTVSNMSSNESVGIGKLPKGSSAGGTLAGEKSGGLESVGYTGEAAAIESDGHAFNGKKDLWAVITATSSGWKNYRHQADALAVYNMLKKNGVDDEHIIISIADDIPTLPGNPIPGDVHNIQNGPNLRKGAVIDYKGNQVTLANFKKIMLGEVTAETPAVIGSGSQSNVLVYIVDHGLPGLLPFESGEGMTSGVLASLTDEMYKKGMFRKMLIMAETCHGESIGAKINTPGVIFYTGSAEDEASYGSQYDYNIRQWLSDDFTSRSLESISANPAMTIEELYTSVYSKIIGSHARLLNYSNCSCLTDAVSDFVKP
jgi:ABC-type branched-subunit amino acid transport system substrate-binding protein